jgi:hypothetical protein
MATLGYHQVAIAGVNPAPAAATGGGDKIAPSDRGALLYANGSGATITVTIVVPGNDKYGSARPDIAVAIPAGESRLIGPFPSDLAGTDGLVAITYSGVTSLTVTGITI